MRRTGRVVAAGLGLALLAGCAVGGAADGAADGAAPPAAEGTVAVLAAASLADVLEDLGAVYEEQHPGRTVTFSFAGSSSLVQQVLAGAPADVLATASTDTMDRAVEAGAVAGDPVVVATNRLVLAVPAGNPGGVTGLADLAEEDLLVALCAEQVPCGAASVRVLEQAGLEAAPDTLEQDVRAVLTRLRLGEVDAGLVYATDVAAAAEEVTAIELDEGLHDAASTDHPVAVLADARSPGPAQDLVDLLTSVEGADVLRRAGFGVP